MVQHSAHLAECCDCSGATVHDFQAHGAACQLFADANCSVIVDSKDVVARRSSSTPSSWRAQASLTRPEEPSLASVGSGMAAGAAFGQRRVRDVGAVRSFSTICGTHMSGTG